MTDRVPASSLKRRKAVLTETPALLVTFVCGELRKDESKPDDTDCDNCFSLLLLTPTRFFSVLLSFLYKTL